AAPVRAGDRVRLGATGPTAEIVDLPAPEPEPSPDSAEGLGATVRAAPQHLALLRGSRGSERFAVGPGGVIGRDPAPAGFPPPHPPRPAPPPPRPAGGRPRPPARPRQRHRPLRQRPPPPPPGRAQPRRPHRHRPLLPGVRRRRPGQPVA